jgi:hypothetical protein
MLASCGIYSGIGFKECWPAVASIRGVGFNGMQARNGVFYENMF